MTKRFVSISVFVLSALGGACNPEATEPEAAEEGSAGSESIDTRAEWLELSGSGRLVDNGTDIIDYRVEPNGDPNKATFVLETTSNITWWKSLDLFAYNNGGFTHVKRIETKDSKHSAQIDFFANEMTTPYKVEFWKAGFWGTGRFVHSIIMEEPTSLGKRFVFTWRRD